VAELDPIRQLQHLLDDPDQVLEKIARIQSALGAVKAQGPAVSNDPRAPILNSSDTASKSEDPPFDRLLTTLRAMQAQIEERLRPLALRTAQAEIEYLRDRAQEDQNALTDRLAQIDRSIAACFERLDETRQCYTELTRINQRLVQLGAVAESLPEDPRSTGALEMIVARLENLRRAGKL
jgi:hypothetical protein